MSKRGLGDEGEKAEREGHPSILRMDVRSVRVKGKNKWENCSCSRNVKHRMCMVGKGTITIIWMQKSRVGVGELCI